MHTTTLRPAGNALELTIPIDLVRELNFHVGENVVLDAKEGCLVVTPVGRLKYSINDLLEMQGPDPLLLDRDWDSMPDAGTETPL